MLCPMTSVTPDGGQGLKFFLPGDILFVVQIQTFVKVDHVSSWEWIFSGCFKKESIRMSTLVSAAALSRHTSAFWRPDPNISQQYSAGTGSRKQGTPSIWTSKE